MYRMSPRGGVERGGVERVDADACQSDMRGFVTAGPWVRVGVVQRV